MLCWSNEHTSTEEVTSGGENNAVQSWQDMEEQLKDLILRQKECQRVVDGMLAEQVAVLSRLTDYSHEKGEQCKTATPQQQQQQREVHVSFNSEPETQPTERALAKTESQTGLHHLKNYSAYELKEVGGKDTKPVSFVQKVKPTFREQPQEWFYSHAEDLLHWRLFEPCMGFFIILNALNIGWALDQELKNFKLPEGDQVMKTTIFLESVFTLELFLRIYVEGIRKCLRTPWNLLDLVLVSVAYVELIVQFLIKNTAARGLLKQVLVLRMFRILRLARAARLVKKFKSLWNLCQGLLNCWGTMMSAFTLMVGTTFLFGCFGAELITKTWREDPQLGNTIEERFSSMSKIMLTLFQFITMDSISAFYWELVLREPLLIIYFMLLLIVVSIALMNLVTAMLVEEAISNQRMDDEMSAFYTRQKLKQLDPKIRQLFARFDTSHDKSIRMQEVLEAMENGMTIPKDLQAFVNHARIVDLFDALDKDQSGEITEDEFVEGLGYMAMSDVPLETMQILHLVRHCNREMVKIKKEIRSKSVMLQAQADRQLTT